MLNSFNINNLGYKLYDEYVDRYYTNALQYSKLNGLPVRYYHININESENYDSEIGLQLSIETFKYDLYEFIPIIDMNRTDQVNFDPNEQGTSYLASITMTIIGIKEPLPGDLFHFYDLTGNNVIDNTEIFRVKRVNYNRHLNHSDKYFIYQIDAEYAPIKKFDLDKIHDNIVNHFYYNSDLATTFDENQLNYYQFLDKNNSNLRTELQPYYDKISATYKNCTINAIVEFIQKNYNSKINIVDKSVLKNKDPKKLILDFMFAFDKLTYLKNTDPITSEKIRDNTNIIKIDGNNEADKNFIKYQVELNPLEYNGDLYNDLEEINKDYKIYFNDQYCFPKINNGNNGNDNPNLIKIFELDFKHKKIIKDVESYKYLLYKTNEYHNDEFYKLYYFLYQILYCYRELDKDFFNKLGVINENKNKNKDNEILTFDEYFYTYNGVLDASFYKQFHQNYNPGYYLSFQDGPHYFDEK